MIKNLVFDLGGVIVGLDKKNCLVTFDRMLGFKDFDKYLNSFLQKGFFQEFENGDINAHQFRTIIRSHSSNPLITDEQIDFAVRTFLTEVKMKTVISLIELKKHYRLFLLSNTNPIAFPRCRELFLSAYGVPMNNIFEKFFLSYEMKCSKPFKLIFEKMLEEAQIVASETLFIDDAKANIETANEIGFMTLCYEMHEDFKEQIQNKLSQL
jgi:HAD superfamily hydrolase (TIGR01509 family)